MQEPSIFTRIIQGEIPSYTIYEDDKTIAILDINPTRYGHTLVITKLQVEQYIDLPDEDYGALWKTVKKVALHLRSVLATERVGVVVEGVDVPHTHVHLLPFNSGESLNRDESSPTLTPEEFTSLADKLRL